LPAAHLYWIPSSCISNFESAYLKIEIATKIESAANRAAAAEGGADANLAARWQRRCVPYDGPGVGGVELLASAASSSRVMSSAASSSSDGIGAEGSKALAGVKILQDVQEELVEKPVLLRGEKEGLVHIIFGLEAILRMVLLEAEQAACNLGGKCASQDHVIMIQQK
jgi:hypothetical protein